jgi:hypothetical protein
MRDCNSLYGVIDIIKCVKLISFRLIKAHEDPGVYMPSVYVQSHATKTKFWFSFDGKVFIVSFVILAVSIGAFLMSELAGS